MKGSFITPDEMLAIPAQEISDPSQIAPEPLVSVIVVTYNHEAYIAQNIEGILAQQCGRWKSVSVISRSIPRSSAWSPGRRISESAPIICGVWGAPGANTWPSA